MIKKKLIPNYPGRTFNDIIYNIKYSFKMLYEFFWVIWNYRPTDYNYTLEILKKSLELQSNAINNGYEEDTSKKSKVTEINRCIELLNNIIDDDYMSRCGYDSNYKVSFVDVKDKPNFKEMVSTETKKQKDHNADVMIKANDLSKLELKELFDTMQYNIKTWWR